MDLKPSDILDDPAEPFGIVSRNAELIIGSDHADANRLALFLWILQPRLLCAFFCPEGL